MRAHKYLSATCFNSFQLSLNFPFHTLCVCVCRVVHLRFSFILAAWTSRTADIRGESFSKMKFINEKSLICSQK